MSIINTVTTKARLTKEDIMSLSIGGGTGSYDDRELRGRISTLEDTSTEHTAKIVELDGRVESLEEGGGTGTGLTQAVKEALHNLFKKTAYIDESGSSLLNALDTAMGYTPQRTLVGISATFTAESAEIGTDPSTLISTVTASYDDGTSESVTGFAVTPTALEEGANTVTVSYGGFAYTHTITGTQARSWTSGVPYADLMWEAGSLGQSGDETESTTYKRTGYIDTDGVNAIKLGGTFYANYQPYFYAEDGKYLGKNNGITKGSFGDGYLSVPYYAKRMRLIATNANSASCSVTPYEFPKLTENTAWESGKYYSLDGWESEGGYSVTTVKANCRGATTIHTSYDVRQYIHYYDADGEILYSEPAGSAKEHAVPDGAYSFTFGVNINPVGSSLTQNNAFPSVVWLE